MFETVIILHILLISPDQKCFDSLYKYVYWHMLDTWKLYIVQNLYDFYQFFLPDSLSLKYPNILKTKICTREQNMSQGAKCSNTSKLYNT